MSILVRFAPAAMTTAQYESVKQEVSQSDGGFPPDGMELHVCFGPQTALRVSEAWESPEPWRDFMDRLRPAIRSAGLPDQEPEVLDIQLMRFADDVDLADDTGVVVRYLPPQMTRAQYDAIVDRVTDHGNITMQECLGHLLLGEEGTLRVSEVWRSAASVERLLPDVSAAAEAEGIDLRQVEIFPCHSLAVTQLARMHATTG